MPHTGRPLFSRTIFSHAPLSPLDTCCEKHRDIPPADCAVAATSFTVESHEDVVRSQKFALMILTDKDTHEAGPELTPEITMMLLDSFADMVKEMCGPNLMAAALVSKVIEKFGAEVFDDESELSEQEAADVARRVERRDNHPLRMGHTYGRRRDDHQN
jgi:hypothetical protein